MNSEELAERAINCKHWRWMPGMRIRGLDKICVGVTANQGSPIYRNGYGNLSPVPHAQPDLTDPATLGCLLALVREARVDPGWQVLCLGDETWSIEGSDYPTEAEALVAALEAADQ